MGRGEKKTKNTEKKDERNRRMAKFGLKFVRPAKVEKDIRKDLAKDRRLGRGPAEMISAALEVLGHALFVDSKEGAGPNHHVTDVHFAKAVSNPRSKYYGAFPKYVPGVYVPVEREEKESKTKK
jgi:hypothetical protein